MPSTPTIIKASTASTSSSSTPSTTAPSAPASTNCYSTNKQAEALAQTFPPSAPHRTTYLASRIGGTVLAVVQITLVAVATGALHRRRWTDFGLSPAIAVLFWHAADVVLVLRCGQRHHRLGRAVYDALLAVGFCVAAGFCVANGLLPASRDGDGAAAGLAGGILACMIVQVPICSCIAVGGIRDIIGFRRAARQADEEAAAKTED
ncbi:hypothetical protein B0T24DRAFT_362905 [Lasiosphaeria ovina]|uniref:Uncharacterized protein n=1 Tax=Lasiosphaeria ovina TaxID=92902 RepID=A0AAE0K4V4_9PEZI|nr:hypothetical protein B0T24DRAFT_362905 [Lasiosphaeria ovina]